MIAFFLPGRHLAIRSEMNSGKESTKARQMHKTRKHGGSLGNYNKRKDAFALKKDRKI